MQEADKERKEEQEESLINNQDLQQKEERVREKRDEQKAAMSSWARHEMIILFPFCLELHACLRPPTPSSSLFLLRPSRKMSSRMGWVGEMMTVVEDPNNGKQANQPE